MVNMEIMGTMNQLVYPSLYIILIFLVYGEYGDYGDYESVGIPIIVHNINIPSVW